MSQAAVKSPLFSSPWWLDAVAPGTWSEAVVRTEGRVAARLAYVHREYPLLGRVISHPPLTPFLGPEFYGLQREGERQVGEQNELMAALIDALPSCSRFQQNFAPEASNWLPFFWRGFTQHTRYTYRLNDLKNLDAVWNNFASSVRGAIRKAQKILSVDCEPSATEVYGLLQETYAHQRLQPKYNRDLFERLSAAACARQQGGLLVARDAQGRAHAGLLLVWDQDAAYYLVGGSDPALRTSGAASYLLWEAIQHAATVTTAFDFEGSMHPGIEYFFRKFGAAQTPYFRVARNNLRGAAAVKLVHGLRKIRQATSWRPNITREAA